MARYRLMLLEAPPRREGAMEALAAALPPGVDAAAFAAMRARAFTDPVLLGSGDELATMEAATATLQQAGLSVCVVDDSTPWIRLAETLRSALGFTTVRAGGPPPEPAAPTAQPEGPALRDPAHPMWKRGVMLLGALLLPIAGALLASSFFGDALYDDPAPGAAMTAPGNPRRQSSRVLSARAGGGGAEAPPVDGHAPQGRGAAAGASEGAAGGDSVELSQDARATEPEARSRRPARGAMAALVAALLGLVSAAAAGEAVERSTRSRSALFRRRLRLAVAGVAGAGALVAPIALWQARATVRSAVSPSTAPGAAAGSDARLISSTRPAGRCGDGGPFTRFVCRSQRPPSTGAPRPFASLLAGYRQRAATSHSDAGAPADVEVAPADVAVAGGARSERHTRHARHARRHHRRPEPVASAGPPSTMAADASLPVEAPSEPEPQAVSAPAAPAIEAVEAPPVEQPPAPAPAPIEGPGRRPAGRGWAGVWFGLGLALGALGAPGWRRLGRAKKEETA